VLWRLFAAVYCPSPTMTKVPLGGPMESPKTPKTYRRKEPLFKASAFAGFDIRFAVAIVTAGLCTYSCICMITMFTPSVNALVGGYGRGTAAVVSVAGLVGFVMGILALLGIYDNNHLIVGLYWHYLVLRSMVSIATFFVDMISLMRCENSGIDMHSRMFFNPVIDKLKKDGTCEVNRNVYVLFFLLDLYFCALNVYMVQHYIQDIQKHKAEHHEAKLRKRITGGDVEADETSAQKPTKGETPPEMVQPEPPNYGSFIKEPSPPPPPTPSGLYPTVLSRTHLGSGPPSEANLADGCSTMIPGPPPDMFSPPTMIQGSSSIMSMPPPGTIPVFAAPPPALSSQGDRTNLLPDDQSVSVHPPAQAGYIVPTIYAPTASSSGISLERGPPAMMITTPPISSNVSSLSLHNVPQQAPIKALVYKPTPSSLAVSMDVAQRDAPVAAQQASANSSTQQSAQDLLFTPPTPRQKTPWAQPGGAVLAGAHAPPPPFLVPSSATSSATTLMPPMSYGPPPPMSFGHGAAASQSRLLAPPAPPPVVHYQQQQPPLGPPHSFGEEHGRPVMTASSFADSGAVMSADSLAGSDHEGAQAYSQQDLPRFGPSGPSPPIMMRSAPPQQFAVAPPPVPNFLPGSASYPVLPAAESHTPRQHHSMPHSRSAPPQQFLGSSPSWQSYPPPPPAPPKQLSPSDFQTYMDTGRKVPTTKNPFASMTP